MSIRTHIIQSPWFQSLSEELGSNPFFAGTQPAAADAQLFGLIMEMEDLDPELCRVIFQSGGVQRLKNVQEHKKRTLQVGKAGCVALPSLWLLLSRPQQRHCYTSAIATAVAAPQQHQVCSHLNAPTY